MTARHWLIRLSFSFLIIAVALVLRGHKAWQTGDHTWRPTAWYAAAAACVVLGMVGVRLRHQKPRD